MGKQILSCRFIRAQEGCLLAIQGYLDSGARDAAVKRRVLVREEETGISGFSPCLHEGARDAPPGATNPLNPRVEGLNYCGQLPNIFVHMP